MQNKKLFQIRDLTLCSQELSKYIKENNNCLEFDGLDIDFYCYNTLLETLQKVKVFGQIRVIKLELINNHFFLWCYNDIQISFFIEQEKLDDMLKFLYTAYLLIDYHGENKTIDNMHIVPWK